ncbi:MAG: hypothetical protein ACOCXS_03865 [Bacteroidota bacterium]
MNKHVSTVNTANTTQHLCYALPVFIIFIMLLMGSAASLKAQPVLMAWGNMNGIRVEGQIMEFETSMQTVAGNWESIRATGKERQRSDYNREGETQTVTLSIDGIEFKKVVKNNGRGSALVTLTAKALKDTVLEGVFFTIDLPHKHYVNPLIYQSGNEENLLANKSNLPIKTKTKGITVEAPERQLNVELNKKATVFIRQHKDTGNYQLYFQLMKGQIKNGTKAEQQFTINATGNIDNSPVDIKIDAGKPGNRFAGFGGNFRLQKPETDSLVIQYCLDNMRLAWGRVEMPWQLWHQDEGKNPIKEAEAGNLHEHVHNSMKMAQRLAKRGMPVIVSAWQAPAWAIIGEPEDAYRFRDQGIFGYPLNPEKTEKIYQSLGDYLEYLKNKYGVEAVMFSFNESDLGINVRHTAEEHRTFIKEFGEHLADRGLATKLLLGDNSDANTFDFILPAMNDPETHKYIGAVSFHSWRGTNDENLNKWAGAARELNVPLIVGEGSTDAAAWRYPEIFYEQSFALYEINLYIRIMAICEPLSILQWQLTADYSPLQGEGIYGTEGPLRPSQRFWNLKQLASTPEDAFALPVTCAHEAVNCAALGNLSRGEYAVHIVNNGAERKATIKGLPEGVSKLEAFVTNSEKEMEKTEEITVVDGVAAITLPPAAYISLFSLNE